MKIYYQAVVGKIYTFFFSGIYTYILYSDGLIIHQDIRMNKIIIKIMDNINEEEVCGIKWNENYVVFSMFFLIYK